MEATLLVVSGGWCGYKASCQILDFLEVIITTYWYLVRNRGTGLFLIPISGSFPHSLRFAPCLWIKTFRCYPNAGGWMGIPFERSSAPSCLIHIFLHICIEYWMEHHGFSLFNMDFNYEFSFTKIMGYLPANYWRLGWDPLVTGGIHISILGVDSLQTSIFGECFLLNLQML